MPPRVGMNRSAGNAQTSRFARRFLNFKKFITRFSVISEKRHLSEFLNDKHLKYHIF
jgi:hypothetical protein